MNFSILHLSDLHRDSQDRVANAWLLESLAHDRDNYVPEVPRPSVCLVTGDLVFGVDPRDPHDAQELERQYHEAEEFLVALADRFFGGDRDRIVIVPGNHDISYCDAMAAMATIGTPPTAEERKRLAAELQLPQPTLRWSWTEMSFLRITDETAYRNRLKEFAGFYTRFYQERRSYPLDPEQQHEVFDFPDLGFSVIALNSCHGNDPLRRAGAIHPGCLAAGAKALRQPHRAGWTVAAAWHHNLSGPPTSDDYLDSGILQALIDFGVSLAFHGHQHRQQCIDERFRLGPNPRKIAVISASTLCSGARHLVPGVPRGYNVVEINTDTRKGKVHVRAMLNLPPEMPIWGPGHVVATQSPYVEFEVCEPLLRRPESLDANLALEEAERLLGQEQWAAATERLEPLVAHDTARPLLLKAIVELGDVHRLRTLLWPPRSSAEAVTAGGVILEHGTRRDAEAFIEAPLVRESADASVREMTRRVRERFLP